MNALNGLLSAVAGLLIGGLASLPAWIPLFLWSAVAGVVMAIVFGFTSPQRRLRRAVDLIRANLLAMKLFRDDLSVTLRCQGRLLVAIGCRLLYSLPPMLVLAPPFVLILTHLAVWFEHLPIRTGDATLVTLRLRPDAWQRLQDTPIQASPGLSVESPPVRNAHRHEITWRVRARAPGVSILRWNLEGTTVEKRLPVADDPARLMPVAVLRPGPDWLDRLLNPAEPGFDADCAARGVVVRHPRRSTPILGFDLPWWATFLIVSILAAVVTRPITRVQF